MSQYFFLKSDSISFIIIHAGNTLYFANSTYHIHMYLTRIKNILK